MMGLVKMVIASAGMSIALWAALPLMGGSGWQLAAVTIGVIVAGSALYWAIAWALKSDEARLFSDFVARRLQRTR